MLIMISISEQWYIPDQSFQSWNMIGKASKNTYFYVQSTEVKFVKDKNNNYESQHNFLQERKRCHRFYSTLLLELCAPYKGSSAEGLKFTSQHSTRANLSLCFLQLWNQRWTYTHSGVNFATDNYLNNVPNTIPPMAGFIPEGSLKSDPLTAAVKNTKLQ